MVTRIVRFGPAWSKGQIRSRFCSDLARHGSDSVQILHSFGPDLAQTGFRIRSGLAPRPDSVQNWFRFGSAGLSGAESGQTSFRFGSDLVLD